MLPLHMGKGKDLVVAFCTSCRNVDHLCQVLLKLSSSIKVMQWA